MIWYVCFQRISKLFVDGLGRVVGMRAGKKIWIVFLCRSDNQTVYDYNYITTN